MTEGFLWSSVWTMLQPFFIRNVLMSPFWLVMMGTLYEISIMLFEVPTGVVADVYSRKLSILVGFVIAGISFVIVGLYPTLWPIAAAQVVLGVGETFISGAREAWVNDELPHSSTPDTSGGKAFMIGSQYDLGARVIGAWVGPILLSAGLALSTVFVWGGIGFVVLAVVMAFQMSERGFKRNSGERQFWGTFRDGWKLASTSKALILLLAASVVLGVSSEGYDRLSQKFISDVFTLPSVIGLPSESFFSLLASCSQILAIILTEVLRRRINPTDPVALRRSVIGCVLVAMFGFAAFVWSPTVWTAALIFVLTRGVRRAMGPLMKAWVNLYAPEDKRATILSFESQAHSLGEIGGGPLAGQVAQWHSVKLAISMCALLMAPAPIILAQMKRVKEESQPA